MEVKFTVSPVGEIHIQDDSFYIQVKNEYKEAMLNMDGFTHIQVLWWGHYRDTPEYRSVKSSDKPYVNGPEKLGVFASRSQFRPNPILLTTVQVTHIDHIEGRIYLAYIDAEPGTPVLDMKPYYKMERIQNCDVPEWCANWPEWYECAAEFAWDEVFNF
jgi:tRNA (Thr-GGU) A37 N-methylase